MEMQIFRSLASWHDWRESIKTKSNARVVFVPTMGALHEGHLSLVRLARKVAGTEGIVVVSIFVNPIQFGPNEDFKSYPRPFDRDCDLCRLEGVDAILSPNPEAMYDPDRSVVVTENTLSQKHCGESRPGHFDGVCTVVLKLFNLVQPQAAIFGKKDYQQLAIIKRMVRDLNVPVEIIGLETVREPSGLAMSSRNQYLDEKAKIRARGIYQALKASQQTWMKGERDPSILESSFQKVLREHAPDAEIVYFSLVNAENLELYPSKEGTMEKVTALCAVKLEGVRLIDNLEFF